MSLVVLGYGYAAAAFVRRARGRFGRVVATVRSDAKAEQLPAEGVQPRIVPGDGTDALRRDLRDAEALLASVPPGPEGDPLLPLVAPALASASRLRWIGYLSTTGVYGDRGGASVHEDSVPAPGNERSRRRLAAERAWQDLGARSGIPVCVFRLSGIYGPGRSAFDALADGTARRIAKPGQVFNRIHVDDIAAVLAASLDRPRAGAVYNVSDDEPAPPGDVVAEAARLAGLPAPPEEPFRPDAMTPAALSFWAENKRVGNRLLRGELGVALAYPSYREGLAAISAAAGKDVRTGPKRAR